MFLGEQNITNAYVNARRRSDWNDSDSKSKSKELSHQSRSYTWRNWESNPEPSPLNMYCEYDAKKMSYH
jgi:hypothetical protein